MQGGGFLGFGARDIIQLVVYIVLLTAFFISLSKDQKETDRRTKENKELIEKLAVETKTAVERLGADLLRHCSDDNEHMGSKAWQELMRRLDSIDRAIERRNEQARQR